MFLSFFLYIFGTRVEWHKLDISCDSQDFLTKLHSMKLWWNGGISPYILSLVSEWMRGIGFMLWRLYSCVNSRRYVLSRVISWKGMGMRKNFDRRIMSLKVLLPPLLLQLPHCLWRHLQSETLLSLEIAASCRTIWDAGFERHWRWNLYLRTDSAEWRLWALDPWRLCSVRRFDLWTAGTSRLLRGWWTGTQKKTVTKYNVRFRLVLVLRLTTCWIGWRVISSIGVIHKALRPDEMY
jgi:hypothetical protein